MTAQHPNHSPPSFWRNLTQAIIKASATVGTWLHNQYHAIDPAFRTHLREAPLLGLTLLAAGQTPTGPIADDGHRLVVFVHGLAGHRGNFIPMQKYFGWMGRTQTISVGFPSSTSIPIMANHLRESIARFVEENHLPPEKGIDIVAHSMGGIVTRLALQDPSFAKHIHTVITLATPHKGTQLARYIDTLKIKELRPSSDLLQELNCQLPWGSDTSMPRLVCFWTPKDLILLPPQSAVAHGAEAVCIHDSSHLGFVLKPAVWEKILNILSPTLGNEAPTERAA